MAYGLRSPYNKSPVYTPFGFESSPTLLMDLAAYYRFDGDLVDSSGNNRTLIAIGDVTYDTGILGQAVNSASLDKTFSPVALATGGAFSFWINIADAGFIEVIAVTIGKNGGAMGAPMSWFWCEVGGDGNLFFHTNIAGQTLVTSILNFNVWHHIVGTTNNNGTVSFYVDNILVGTLECDSDAEDIRYVKITATQNFHSFKIDEVAIYARDLSLANIEDLYKDGNAFDPTDIELYNLDFSLVKNSQYLVLI